MAPSNPTDVDSETVRKQTPGQGITPSSSTIQPDVPESFGLVQVWWGDGKGKTTAALGMGFRAAGHGYRVHLLQFMKGGADSVESTRGEYNAIAAFPGFTYENLGHYGWHGLRDGSDDSKHEVQAQAGFERAQEIVAAAADVSGSIPSDAPIEKGCHMLILDEILYAANRDLISKQNIIDLLTTKPDSLELILTGGHEKPAFIYEHADLVSRVGKEKHPIDSGQRARKGTEY